MRQFRILERPLYLAVAVFSLGAVQAEAGAISVNFNGLGFAFAGAVVPGVSDFDVDGPRIGGTTVLAIAFSGPNLAMASAKTRPPFGIDVDAGVVVGVGLADFSDPFVAPIVPVPGVLGQADLHYDGSFTDPATFSIVGNGSRNANGFLELGVVDIADNDFSALTSALMIAGSVEKAVALGLIPRSLVLATFRDNSLVGSFNISVSLGSTPRAKVVVTGIAHAVAVATPEPSTMMVVGFGLAILLLLRFRLKKRTTP